MRNIKKAPENSQEKDVNKQTGEKCKCSCDGDNGKTVFNAINKI